jgi:putative transposase
VFRNFVHLVFVTKYRRAIFTPPMLVEIEKGIREACTNLKGELLEFGGEDDHIHLMVSVPPTTALCHFIGP